MLLDHSLSHDIIYHVPWAEIAAMFTALIAAGTFFTLAIARIGIVKAAIQSLWRSITGFDELQANLHRIDEENKNGHKALYEKIESVERDNNETHISIIEMIKELHKWRN